MIRFKQFLLAAGVVQAVNSEHEDAGETAVAPIGYVNPMIMPTDEIKKKKKKNVKV